MGKEIKLKGSYESNTYKILLALAYIFAIIGAILYTRGVTWALSLLLLFPIVRTIFIKNVEVEFRNGKFLINSEKDLDILNEKILSYEFFRPFMFSTFLKSKVKVMEEYSLPCKCQINYKTGSIVLREVDYLAYQFLDYYLGQLVKK